MMCTKADLPTDVLMAIGDTGDESALQAVELFPALLLRTWIRAASADGRRKRDKRIAKEWVLLVTILEAQR
jgi:hypothetical protein